MAKSRQEIIDSLVQAKPEIEKCFGVRRMAIFGSYARGDFAPESDVDVMVDVEATIGLDFVTPAEAIEHARRVVEEWQRDYNEERPHSALGYLTPREFVRLEEEKLVATA